jgi:hypothetical protein
VSAVRVSALLIALGLLGCPPVRSDDDDATADDDDATADDDDATSDDDDATADDDDATAPWNPVSGELPCEEEVVDLWSVTAPEGAAVSVLVDTIAAETAFDPRSSAFDGTDPDADPFLGSGDDNVPCTYPPPSFSCPFYEVVAGASGAVGITVAAFECPDDPGYGEYSIAVLVDGGAATPVLIADDLELGGGGEPPPTDPN